MTANDTLESPSLSETIPATASSNDTYRLGINTLFDTNSSAIISNGTQEHAALLFELFFRKATDRVVIFCEKLSEAIFDQGIVVEAAVQALNLGRRISIISQSRPESQKFIELAKKFSNLEIVTATNEEVKNLEVNFAVVDHRAYRFEPRRGDCKAQARMFDVPGAIQLLDTFQRLKLLATASIPIAATATA